MGDRLRSEARKDRGRVSAGGSRRWTIALLVALSTFGLAGCFVLEGTSPLLVGRDAGVGGPADTAEPDTATVDTAEPDAATVDTASRDNVPVDPVMEGEGFTAVAPITDGLDGSFTASASPQVGCEAHPNGCGGCEPLEREPGTACGLFGALVCDGPEAVTCSGDYTGSAEVLEISIDEARAVLPGATGRQVGRVVAGVGDVDGNGFDDLGVGLPGDGESGSVFILGGPLSGTLDLEQAAAVLSGEAVGDQAGWSLASAGDVDADGFDDLLVGAPGRAGGGAAYLLYGPVTGTVDLSDADAVFAASTDGDDAGWSVAGAGDVNGDGFGDVLVGAPRERSRSGTAGVGYVIFGPLVGTIDLGQVGAGVPGAVLVGEAAGDQAGFAVAGAGDVNGDGYGDVILGAPVAGSPGDRGAAFVLWGPVSGAVSLADVPESVPGARFRGQTPASRAGHAVAGGGDVNGDGLADILIGAPQSRSAGEGSGTVYLFQGPVEGELQVTIAERFWHGRTEHGQLGTSVTLAGDLDGDGFDDIALGGPGDDREDDDDEGSGVVYVVFGGEESTDLGVVILGEEEGDLTGQGVALVRGISPAGMGALAIGCPGSDSAGVQAGAVHFFFAVP